MGWITMNGAHVFVKDGGSDAHPVSGADTPQAHNKLVEEAGNASKVADKVTRDSMAAVAQTTYGVEKARSLRKAADAHKAAADAYAKVGNWAMQKKHLLVAIDLHNKGLAHFNATDTAVKGNAGAAMKKPHDYNKGFQRQFG